MEKPLSNEIMRTVTMQNLHLPSQFMWKKDYSISALPLAGDL